MKPLISLVAFLSALLAAMNVSVLFVAMNEIRGNLGGTNTELKWIVIAYVLGGLIIMPFSSWLSRRLGNKTYFVAAVLLFAIGSFLCGNATTINQLTIFRFVQGIDGGAMLVLSQAILTEKWDKHVFAQSIFIMGILTGVTVAAMLAGYLTDEFSWSYIFFASIPPAVVICILIFICIKNESNEEQISIKDRNLITGVIVIFIAAFVVAACDSILMSYLRSAHHMPTLSLWRTSRILLSALVFTTAVLQWKQAAAKYLIAAGLLLLAVFAASIYRSVPASFMNALFIIRGVAIIFLSVPAATLALSTLERKQLHLGAVLFNMMLILGTWTAVALFY